MSKTVQTEVRGRVLIVRMQRESKRNAIDEEIAFGIDAALNMLDDDPELWVGVLTGTPKVFSAGTDLKSGGRATTERGGEYGLIRRQRRKPLIAAVEGPAFGGGFEIAMACDLIVASASAEFSLPESRRGVLATSGALFRLTRSLPIHLAKELLITGAVLGAARAHEFGLVNRLSEQGDAERVAVEVAEEICLSSPVSVQESLAVIRALTAEEDARGWELTRAAMDTVAATKDIEEGVSAFFERRAPNWSGR